MTIFEKIASREIPAFVIWENDTHIAFLSIEPQCKGHTVVAPKTNIGDQVFELSTEQYDQLMDASREVASLLKNKLKVDRVLMVVEGFEVPHVHTKLYPVHVGFNLYESSPTQANQEELQAVFNRITT